MPWKSTILSAATLHVRSSNAIVLDQVPSECSPPPRLTRLRQKAVNGYLILSDRAEGVQSKQLVSEVPCQNHLASSHTVPQYPCKLFLLVLQAALLLVRSQ